VIRAPVVIPCLRTDFFEVFGQGLRVDADGLSVTGLMVPFSQGRGIASANFDGDGWPDLAVANNRWVSLYHNIEGRRFEEIPLNLERLNGVSSLVVAFTGHDNDGCPDLFVGAFGDFDIISRLYDQVVSVYVNGLQSNHSIVFEFRDEAGSEYVIFRSQSAAGTNSPLPTRIE
jgi:hypothetical protein